MNFQSGDGPAIGDAVPPEELVERVLQLQPVLQQTLRVPLPDEVSSRLGTVTPHQLEALGRLPPEGITMREFAEAVGISGAAATALANRMIRQGLAKRRYDPSDRRTVWLAPTRKGLDTAGAVQEWRRRSVAKIFERLDAAQVTAFLEVLSALAMPHHLQDAPAMEPPGSLH
ncbi:MAG TPA: MarR family transcriptional regulator [Candidatus Micrarchaeaceae archaeon]|nr:MarR family transcriptional regulator [Candidatus Micrarchaeaceae archaeon]